MKCIEMDTHRRGKIEAWENVENLRGKQQLNKLVYQIGGNIIQMNYHKEKRFDHVNLLKEPQ